MSTSDPSQTYALYLPAAYAPVRKWPVLYCFDPGARGSVPLERFRAAAEKFGYILIGSNNSRNGPDVPIGSIIKTLWDDTHMRFAIDDRRVLVAGFSGGARVATVVGYTYTGIVAGVIACSGGFPGQLKPSSQTPFAFFGTAGIDDFNNPEMRRLDRALESLERPHRLSIFDGGHEWAPADLCTEAIEWMELQMMRTGRRQRSEPFIDELYSRNRAVADDLYSSGHAYEAYLRYTDLAADFANLRDVSESKRKASELKDNAEVRAAIRREKNIEEQQVRRSEEFGTLREALQNAETRTSAFSDLKALISRLRKAADLQAPTPDRAIARRLLSLYFVQSYERGTAAMYLKNFAGAVTDFSICVELQPENPRANFRLARAYYSYGDKKKAREILKIAVDKGFDDNDALDQLRSDLDSGHRKE